MRFRLTGRRSSCPRICHLFATTFVFIAILDPVRGIFNQFLGLFGIPAINWLGDPATAKLGLVMIAQLGAGRSPSSSSPVSREYRSRSTRRPRSTEPAPGTGSGTITLPMMTPVILYDIILGLSLGLNQFVVPYVIGNGVGNPANSLLLYVVYLYLNAFRYSQMGYAAAMSGAVRLSFLMALAGLPVVPRWVHYDTV